MKVYNINDALLNARNNPNRHQKKEEIAKEVYNGIKEQSCAGATSYKYFIRFGVKYIVEIMQEIADEYRKGKYIVTQFEENNGAISFRFEW